MCAPKVRCLIRLNPAVASLFQQAKYRTKKYLKIKLTKSARNHHILTLPVVGVTVTASCFLQHFQLRRLMLLRASVLASHPRW